MHREVPLQTFSLLIDDLFDVADLLLNLAFGLISLPLGFEVPVADGLAGAFFDFALQIFSCAFRFVLGAGFHGMFFRGYVGEPRIIGSTDPPSLRSAISFIHPSEAIRPRSQRVVKRRTAARSRYDKAPTASD